MFGIGIGIGWYWYWWLELGNEHMDPLGYDAILRDTVKHDVLLATIYGNAM